MNHDYTRLKNINKGSLYIIISGLFFAIVNISVKMLPHITTSEIVFSRSLITLIITSFIIYQQKLPIKTPYSKILMLRGFFGAISLYLFFLTLKNAPLAHAVTIVHLSPIFTVIFAIFIVKEKPEFKQWPFILLSFLGVYILKYTDENFQMTYLLTGLMAAIFAGLAYNCIRLLKNRAHHYTIVFYFPLIAIPLTLIDYKQWSMPYGAEWFWLLINGIFTLLGQVYMTKGYLLEKASKISHFNFLAPVYAVILGFIFFQESLNLLSLIGILIIGIGIVFTSKYSHQN